MNISDMSMRKALSWRDYALCLQCRTRVFVIEQNVPASVEVDRHEDDCVHYLVITNEDTCIATLRYRIVDSGIAKIERLAVIPEYRGYGIGRCLMEYVLAHIEDRNDIVHTKLNAQDHSLPFYEKLGFAGYGEGFMETGIEHHEMYRNCSLQAKSGS